MNRTLLLLCLILGINAISRGETPPAKGVKSINRLTAEAHVEFLAQDELLGREAGSPGARVAGHYIVSVLKSLGISPLGNSYYHPFVACHAERQKVGRRWQVHPDSIRQLQKEVHQRLDLNNIFGVIEGRNPDEIVIIGAHYDHLGHDVLLAGDQIYNGADDNASGVSAVLQIARAFLATGRQPERTVIFAFWDGEEKGLLGSRAFTATFPRVGDVKAYLNFDMIGRNTDESRPRHVVYFYTESHPLFEQWLREDIREYGLRLEPEYRPWDKPVGGSDNAPFALREIPIIWYHTNGHPDYHQPGDHVDKINWEKLVDITRAAFLNMWHLANDKTF